MRGLSCNDYESDRPVKDEYSAAPLIPGIPPFCENFYFNEKIQGGSHFFAFADHFVDLYRHFVNADAFLFAYGDKTSNFLLDFLEICQIFSLLVRIVIIVFPLSFYFSIRAFVYESQA